MVVISIYRLPSQNSEYFLNYLTKIIDYFANAYDNHLILGVISTWNQQMDLLEVTALLI